MESESKSSSGTKRRKKSFLSLAKKNAKKGKFGLGNHIKEDTFQYFVRVMEINRDDFSSKEDRDTFVNNVFDETVGEEVNYSCNQFVSRVIENLIPSVNDEVLERFLSAFFKEIRPVCCHPFGSHVLQILIITAAKRGQEDDIKTETDSSTHNTKSEYNKWICKVSQFVLNNLEEFAWNTYANHVIRTIMECLSGVASGTTVGRSKKWSKKEEGTHKDKPLLGKTITKVPEEYQDLLREFCRRLIAWPQLSDLAYDSLTSGLLQTLLFTINVVDGKLTSKLIRKLLDECFVTDANDVKESSDDKKEDNTSENIPAVFQSESSTKVLEAAIAVASKKHFTQLYHMCFINRLATLAQAPFANFSVQQLFTHCREKPEFEAMFDEIAEKFDCVFTSRNTGVILNLGEACVRLSTRQSLFMKLLMKCLHCLDPEDRQVNLVYAVLQLKTYEQWEENKDTFYVHLHGSLLVQTMLKFNKPIKIVNGLLNMNISDLKTLFCDPKGSHVMDVFMSSEYVGERSRERLINKLKGIFVALACSKHGSRSVDAIWIAATLKQKILIMNELVPKEAILNGNQFGCILASKCGLSLYKHRPEDWKDVQGKEDRRKKLFADIIGDVGMSKASKNAKV